MLFLFVAFIIGLSGSVFGAVIYGKEPGRIIPVTWMGIVTTSRYFSHPRQSSENYAPKC